ncbi:MAG: YIP1 family protein [Gemmatimonadota bacterium]|nr:MAG: YIP1 family protein [Gemmatimonadota bacterium]
MRSGPANCATCGAPILPGDSVCPFCGVVAGPPPHYGASPEPSSAVRFESAPGSPDPALVGSGPPPWETRRDHGFLAALWLTWRESVFRPVPFFRQLPPRAGLGPALGYAALLSAVALLFSLYWGLVEGALSGGQAEEPLILLIGGLVMALFSLAVMLPVSLGLLFLAAGVLHVSLMIVGAGRRGFEATFRALAYSAGPAAFAILPFFGSLLSLVWGTVLIYIAVREVQRTTSGRAALGFLLPFVGLLAFVLILGFLVAALIGTADTAPAAGS